MITIDRKDGSATITYKFGEHPLDIETLVIDDTDGEKIHCTYSDGFSEEPLGYLIVFKSNMDKISNLTERNQQYAMAMLLHFLMKEVDRLEEEKEDNYLEAHFNDF